jgi:hypothetical protein
VSDVTLPEDIDPILLDLFGPEPIRRLLAEETTFEYGQGKYACRDGRCVVSKLLALGGKEKVDPFPPAELAIEVAYAGRLDVREFSGSGAWERAVDRLATLITANDLGLLLTTADVRGALRED